MQSLWPGANCLLRSLKKYLPNCKSLLLLIFLHYLIRPIVFFHSFTLNSQTNFVFIWSNIYLLILPVSFLDGFMNLVVGWLVKFSLWCFRVTEELPVPIISILFNISACFANLIHFLLIFVAMFLFVYLQVVVISFFKRFW